MKMVNCGANLEIRWACRVGQQESGSMNLQMFVAMRSRLHVWLKFKKEKRQCEFQIERNHFFARGHATQYVLSSHSGAFLLI